MKTDKKMIKSAAMIAGALLTTTLAATPSFGADILAYNHLGSGAELRSHLIDMNSNQINPQETHVVKFAELKCGEGKCGEGKCGEGDKKEAKKSETTETKATESKSTEAKSGEGEKKEADAKKKKEKK
jgi:uncharacterized low-complexity protein